MTEYPHNRGADLAAVCKWKNSDGSNYNLTGLTLTAFEVEPVALQSAVTFNVTAPTTGDFIVNLPWSSSWPSGLGDLVEIGVQTNSNPKKSFKFNVILIDG
jgi:hypothetical protein